MSRDINPEPNDKEGTKPLLRYPGQTEVGRVVGVVVLIVGAAEVRVAVRGGGGGIGRYLSQHWQHHLCFNLFWQHHHHFHARLHTYQLLSGECHGGVGSFTWHKGGG